MRDLTPTELDQCTGGAIVGGALLALPDVMNIAAVKQSYPIEPPRPGPVDLEEIPELPL